ncbi:MAG: hypothetical protein ACE5JH_05015 [Acidobacteriota bacterium]
MTRVTKRVRLSPFLLLALFMTEPNRASASCGASSCFLVTGTQEGIQQRGRITLDLSYRYISQDRKRRGTGGADEVLAAEVSFEQGRIDPGDHREIRTVNKLAQLDLNVGVTERFSLALTIPFLNDRDHEHFDEVGTPDEFFTRQDGTSGFGDVRLVARLALVVSARDLLVGGIGAKLPTGEWKLRDSEGDINEPTLMPGTGSYDAVASIYYDHQWIPDRLDGFLSGSYQANGQNGLDYDFGDITILNAGVNWAVTPVVLISGQLNARITPHDRFLNRLVPNTGATIVNLTPGITLTSPEGTRYYLHVSVPVYEDVNDAQLTPAFSVTAGLSKTF